MHTAFLTIENLSHCYSSQKVLQQISFNLQKNEIACLLGASGSGKTTLFKILAGICPIQEGMITYNHSQSTYQNLIAYLTQEDLLLPWRTVLQNMTLTSELGYRPAEKKQRDEEALNLLQEMGLQDYANSYPSELSGGMRQRINLARALLLKRPLLLLDEPFTGLDVHLREQFYELLLRLKEEKKLTILFITHDFRDALTLSDRILFLKEGKIYQTWSVGEVERKAPEKMFQELRQAFY